MRAVTLHEHGGLDRLVYEPDFLLPPLGFIPRTPPAAPDASPNAKIVSANWNKFVETIKPLPQPEEGTEPTRCASACAMAFSGGIDRQGIVRLHRPLNSGAIKDVKEKGDKSDLSLLTTMERLQRAERERTAVLEQMDPGESFIRATRMQPTNFTVPATATRTPSYVSDLMLAVCGSDAAQLQDLDTQTRSAIEYVDWNGEGFVDSERLRLALRTIYQRREQVEACVAALHEKERLKRFAEACKQQPCSLAAVLDAVKKQHRAVTAAARLPKSERKK